MGIYGRLFIVSATTNKGIIIILFEYTDGTDFSRGVLVVFLFLIQVLVSPQALGVNGPEILFCDMGAFAAASRKNERINPKC
jgi:hypothetical protein